MEFLLLLLKIDGKEVSGDSGFVVCFLESVLVFEGKRVLGV